MQTDVNLHTATDDGDADAVISYSDHSEELHKRLKYLRKMKADTESRPAFSLDDIMQTWLDICEQKRPDFQSLLSRIEVLANEYRAACDDLLKLEDVLLSTRGELEHIAEKEGMHAYFRPVLTVGVIPEPLKISKIDGIKPGFIIHDLTGTSL